MTSTKGAPASPTLHDWIILAFLGLIWGASFLGVEMALTGYGPFSVAAGRVAIAAVILVFIAIFFGDGLPKFDNSTNRRIWLHCFAMGLFTNVLPFTLLSWGQQHVTSSFAGICMAVVPLFVLPLAHYLLPDERMSIAKGVGFLFGFIGVVMLVGGNQLGIAFTFLKSESSLMMTAQFACVIASCCYAIGSINTRLCPPISTLSYSATGLMLGSFMLLPTAFYIEGIPALPEISALAGILYLAIFPTAVATLLLTVLINRAGPTFLSLVNYQVPVWAVLIGTLALSEALPGHFISALIIILAGLAISQFYDRWRRKKVS
ncbi:DMT family transporter [Alphaproteobacteria bacterium]|nr:DMT family transporter [Alphaproteobacteria bacterium]